MDKENVIHIHYGMLSHHSKLKFCHLQQQRRLLNYIKGDKPSTERQMLAMFTLIYESQKKMIIQTVTAREKEWKKRDKGCKMGTKTERRNYRVGSS